jgi:flagellar motor protein MotB
VELRAEAQEAVLPPPIAGASHADLGELRSHLLQVGAVDLVQTTARQGHLALVLAVETVFEPAAAKLQPLGRRALAYVAMELRHRSERIRVEGQASPAIESEWSLSASRVREVADALSAGGVGPAMISVAVLGDLGGSPTVERSAIAIVLGAADLAPRVRPGAQPD